jgi:hypothetical protein
LKLVNTVPLLPQYCGTAAICKDLRKYKFIGKDINDIPKQTVYVLSLTGRLVERVELISWWFDVLTKSKKQEFEQMVHMSWERGSVYFDTVKI